MLGKKQYCIHSIFFGQYPSQIYFWYFYDSALHNVCIIKYDVHIERCMPCCWGSFIAELPDHWFLSCCRPRAHRARGQMRRSSFASGRFTNEHSNPLHHPHQQLLKESTKGILTKFVLFHPSVPRKRIQSNWKEKIFAMDGFPEVEHIPISAIFQ